MLLSNDHCDLHTHVISVVKVYTLALNFISVAPLSERSTIFPLMCYDIRVHVDITSITLLFFQPQQDISTSVCKSGHVMSVLNAY
jgi:hypothetical protein